MQAGACTITALEDTEDILKWKVSLSNDTPTHTITTRRYSDKRNEEVGLWFAKISLTI